MRAGVEHVQATHGLEARAAQPPIRVRRPGDVVRPPPLGGGAPLGDRRAPALAGLGLFLLGAGPILWTISTTTLRQTVTPPDLLGRVSAINIMAYGARPLGSALGAALLMTVYQVSLGMTSAPVAARAALVAALLVLSIAFAMAEAERGGRLRRWLGVCRRLGCATR